MSEDESVVKPDIRSDGELLLYDYFKWVTTLSLLTLGGVLSLSEASDIELSNFKIGMVLVPICVAGATGLSGADAIVRSRAAGISPKFKPVNYMRVSIAGLGIGTGAFLSMFWDVLG